MTDNQNDVKLVRTLSNIGNNKSKKQINKYKTAQAK
jgi:hypothetical protein